MFFGNNNENMEYLFLEKLNDLPNNGLTILVSPSNQVVMSAASIKNEKNEKLHNILSSSTQLIPDKTQIFKIHFEQYIIYQTRNESYASNKPNEIYRGKGLIIFEKSTLLETYNEYINGFIVNAHFDSNEIRHYGIYTLDHIIDVISPKEPIIQKVEKLDID